MSAGNYTFQASDLTSGAMQKLMDKRIRKTFYQGTLMWDHFKQKRIEGANDRLRELVHHITPGQVHTYRGDPALLPRAQPEQEIRSEYGYTVAYKPFSFTDRARLQMGRPDALMSEAQRIDSYAESFKSELSTLFYGDGSGAYAIAEGADADDPNSGDAADRILTLRIGTDDRAGVGSYGVSKLYKGSLYDVVTYTGSSNTYKKTILVTDIFAEDQIQLQVVAGSTAIAAGDILVAPGTVPTTGVSYAFNGLGYHLITAATTSWQNVTDIPIEMRSTVKDMDGASLTPGMANYLEDVTRYRRKGQMGQNGGFDKSLIVISPANFSKVKNHLNILRRAKMDDKVLTTGATGIQNQYGNNWMPDDQCPDTRMYNLWEDAIAVSVLQDIDFVDMNGSGGKYNLRPYVSGETYWHIYDGNFNLYFQVVGKDPQLLAAFIDIGTSGLPFTAANSTYSFD